MNQILDLLIQYWKPIIGILFTIAGFIIALIKKKPVSNILTDIYYYSVQATKECEAVAKLTGIKDEVKLARAVEFVFGKIKGLYPTINVNDYYKITVDIIENLLSTPHKTKES